MKKLIAAAIAAIAVCSASADTKTRKMTSYDFSVVRESVEAGESIFYDISYTPHRSITPIHVYILAAKELSFTEDELAAMFEYLSEDTFLYYEKDALAPLHLPEGSYEVVSRRSGGKDNFIFIRQKL